MTFIGRHKRVLLRILALAALAATVAFARPAMRLLGLALDVEQRFGLALLPALIVLSVVAFLHQRNKRHEARAAALAAEREADEAESRAEEMELLVTFGQSLGRSLDIQSIHEVVAQQLPRLVGYDGAWVMICIDARWHALMGPLRDPKRGLEKARQRVAERALAEIADAVTPQPRMVDGHLCVPLDAGGHTLGVLGVPEASGPFPEARRRSLLATATMLAISVRNAQLFREVHENSLRDGLTGCSNRTHALDAIDVELRRSRRSQSPLALIMLDVDNFKDINDCYGHLCGDAVLAAVGSRMREVLRGSDLKCRYGGDEFLIALPDTPLDGAERVAEALRAELAGMSIEWKEDVIRITTSCGVAVSLLAEADAHALIARADAALYRAKDRGRNRVELATEPAVA